MTDTMNEINSALDTLGFLVSSGADATNIDQIQALGVLIDALCKIETLVAARDTIALTNETMRLQRDAAQAMLDEVNR